MDNDKTRTSLTLPTPLYNLLHADSLKYGIAKSSIVAALLLNYYRDNLDHTDLSDIKHFIAK